MPTDPPWLGPMTAKDRVSALFALPNGVDDGARVASIRRAQLLAAILDAERCALERAAMMFDEEEQKHRRHATWAPDGHATNGPAMAAVAARGRATTIRQLMKDGADDQG